jgi:hypothetical protein
MRKVSLFGICILILTLTGCGSQYAVDKKVKEVIANEEKIAINEIKVIQLEGAIDKRIVVTKNGINYVDVNRADPVSVSNIQKLDFDFIRENPLKMVAGAITKMDAGLIVNAIEGSKQLSNLKPPNETEITVSDGKTETKLKVESAPEMVHLVSISEPEPERKSTTVERVEQKYYEVEKFFNTQNRKDIDRFLTRRR